MRRLQSLRSLVPAALVFVLVAAPAAAYTIYLKDGSRVIATEKYTIQGDRALIKLPSGTVSTIKAAEIDVARTDAANKGNYGTAMVLEGGQVKDTPAAPPPPAPGLSTLIAAKTAGVRELPEVKRESPEKAAPLVAGKTAGGFLDYSTVAHTPLPIETTAEVQRLFYEHGLRDMSAWRGTKPDRVLVEVTVTSEATTFKAIAVAAKVLDSFRQQHRADITAIELSLPASQGGHGGQFLLTGEQAADLLANRLEISSYYVQNLQF